MKVLRTALPFAWMFVVMRERWWLFPFPFLALVWRLNWLTLIPAFRNQGKPYHIISFLPLGDLLPHTVTNKQSSEVRKLTWKGSRYTPTSKRLSSKGTQHSIMYLWAASDLWPEHSSTSEPQDWKSCHHEKAECKGKCKECKEREGADS